MMGMNATSQDDGDEGKEHQDDGDAAFGDTGHGKIIKGDPKAWWQRDSAWTCINVGGGIETIWLKKGNTVWAGLQGKQWYHTCEGGPSNWKCWSQPSPQEQMLKNEMSKLQKQVAKLTKMLTATKFALAKKQRRRRLQRNKDKKAKTKTPAKKRR